MNFYAISALTNGLISTILGIFVVTRNRKDVRYLTYGLFCLSVSVWSYFYFTWQLASDEKLALLCCRGLMIGAIFTPIAYLHHLLVSFDLYNRRKKLIIYGYLGGLFFLILGLTPLFVKDVTQKLNFRFWPNPGIVYHPFLILWACYVIYGLFIIIAEYKKSTGVRKNQVKYILLATLIGWVGGATNYPLWYNIPVLPLGNIFVSAYMLILAYAIIRYRLMDIRLALTRAGIFTIVYAFVLGVPFLIGYLYGLWKYSTLLMLFLATLGPFIYTRLERQSKELLYKTEFKRYEALRKFSKTLLLIKDLNQLVELIVYRLVKTLKVSYASIYLYDKEADVYTLKSYRPQKYSSPPKERHLTKNNDLIKLVFKQRKELFYGEIKDLPNKDNNLHLGAAQAEMQNIRATLIIPHFLDRELLGFLVLGDKEEGMIYTEEDISILSALSNSAALAIENALFLIDLNITQAELFDTKRIAELGYMASAMGHEINNRLQAIYSAALDLADNPIVYDAVKNNAQTKAAFDKDIQFINENVEDATKIINELKTYARPQDKARQVFEPVDIEEVIDKALTIVTFQSVKAFDAIDLDVNIPQTPPRILGNFIQLQQVFVNMLNNAHDAIVEKKEYVAQHPELNPAGYKPAIRVNMEELKNSLHIHVIDNGIGMTEEVKRCIFIPLYTSKASSERKNQRDIKGGTGIGLYTIQTIIKAHKGAISVYKTERLGGTDFLITLPIAR